MKFGRAGRMGIVLFAALFGCQARDELPHFRLGALPFPGPFTLYEPSGVSELGAHRYAPWWERPFEESEGARGIVYTCRAGFLDLAHVRETVDWTRCVWRHTRDLLLAGGGSFTFERDGCGFVLSVSLPEGWQDLSPPARAALMESAAVSLAQRAAYDIQTWHEVATWFGWRTVPLVSEAGSSFTWDDTTSHLVGVLVAGRILRDGDEDYDRRVTAALRSALEEFRAVPRPLVDLAARSVEDVWWRDGVAIRRDLDTGIQAGYKIPWLAPDPGCCTGCRAAVLSVPTLRSAEGQDLSGAYRLRTMPPPWMLARIMDAGAVPHGGITSEDFPAIISAVRAQMAARFGPNVDRPTLPARMVRGDLAARAGP